MDVKVLKVLILPNDVDGEELKLIKYNYPEWIKDNKTDKNHLTIAIKKDFSEIYELVKWSREQSSYLIDDDMVTDGPIAVKSDADAFIVTKIDAIFLLIPYLMAMPQLSGVERPVFSFNDLLESPEMCSIHDIVRYAQHTNLDLEQFCDPDQSSLNSQFFFSESKTLNLLKSKVDRLVKYLQSKSADSESCKWYAFDIVAGYLNSPIREKLMSFCNLGPVHGLQKRKLSQLNDENAHISNKKQSRRDPIVKRAKSSVKNNTLITSFFKKAN